MLNKYNENNYCLMNFLKRYSDYPLSTANLLIEPYTVSDSDIPSGNGGINGEQYTYRQLRHQPIIRELMCNIQNGRLRKYAEECNTRNQSEGFHMFKVENEYCFWGLRVGPVVKTPLADEMKRILLSRSDTAQAVREHRVTAAMIRVITYDLLQKEVARLCNMTYSEAALAIGNQLDCAPHEDISGYIFMVPNWAHKWFRHDGYVSKMLREL